MKILVTGAAGFIGSNFVFYMLDKHPEYKIVGCDALTYAGNLETLRPAMENENFDFVKGDIADRERIFSLFEKEQFDIVVNFAAESHVDRSIEDPGIFLKTNIIGTQVLMDAFRKFGGCDTIKSVRTRCTETCRWISRICFFLKLRRLLHPVLTLHQRHPQIYW